MRVCGFTFIRNGLKFDYPFLESLRSLLPLCDTVIVAVGKSEDGTREAIQNLHSNKIQIIDTLWDDTLRSGGSILSQQTNLAFQHATGDWAFYLQGDEILHEDDYPAIREAMEQYRNDPSVEGLLFSYIHFYGSYRFIGNSRRWYRREIRIVRPDQAIQSWGDAQGFRKHGKKLHVKLIPAHIYHYGWVKPPNIQQLKQQHFNKYWHSDAWMKSNIPEIAEYDYNNGGKLAPFTGTHPSVMHDRVANAFWNFAYHPEKIRQSTKERLLENVERWTGWRIGEYKNYIKL